MVRAKPDYLYVQLLEPQVSVKWVTDSLIKGRRIALYGIGVCFSHFGSERVEMSPCIPCMSPLIRLVKKYATDSQFEFDSKKRIWKRVR